MSELKITYEARLQAEAERAAHWESRSGQLELAQADLQRQLDGWIENVRAERDGWNQDRERLGEECRALGHRLVEKQQEVDQLLEQVRTMAGSRPQMTVSTVPLQEAAIRSIAGDPPADWHAERQRLEARVVELEQQLSESRQFTQGMLGSEALAEFRSATIDEQADSQVAELESQLKALQRDSAEACSWRGKYDGARSRVEQLEEQLTASPKDVAENDEPLAHVHAHCDDQLEPAPASDPETLADERACLAEAAQLLRRERDEFAQTQAEFEMRWREWEETLRGKEQLLNRQAQQLADQLERATARTEEIERERTQLAQQRTVLESQAAVLLAATTAGAIGLETDAKSLSVAPLVHPKLDECSTTSAAFDAPTSEGQPGNDDVQRPRARGQVPEHCAAQFASPPSPASDKPQSVWTPPNTPAPAADDDSIEAYMSRLLRRVRGDGTSGAAAQLSPPMPKPALVEATVEKPAEAPLEVALEAPFDDSQQEPSEQVTRTVVAHIEPVMPEDYLPRNKAPVFDLAAMRELANSAARTAIVKYQRSTDGNLALTQSVGAILTLICAAVAAYFALKTESLAAAGGACVGVLAATYWGSKAAVHGLKALMPRAPTEPSAVPLRPAPSPAPLPEAPADPTREISMSVEAADAVASEPAPEDGPKGADPYPLVLE